jgi:hypothetical protein
MQTAPRRGGSDLQCDDLGAKIVPDPTQTRAKTISVARAPPVQERHPLMSFRPLTLLLAVFWMLVIAVFVWLWHR